MENFEDLKAVWRTAKTDDLPGSDEIKQVIRSFRKQKLIKKWLLICSCLLFSGLVIAVLCMVSFRLMTTYIGAALMIMSLLQVAASNIRSLKRFNQLDNCSNAEFLEFIEKTRQNQYYFYKKTQVKVVFLCSVGWLMYLYELVYQHPLMLVCTYVAGLSYLAVLWFVIRPRSFRKHSVKLDVIRERLEKISNQLK